jgi:tRNA1(Val) A37 N6-methylase TrmN6
LRVSRKPRGRGVFTIPNEFDLVIMNPPFARATGRTESHGEGSESRGLFGFIANVAQKRTT